MTDIMEKVMTPRECELYVEWLKGIPYEVAFWKSYYGHEKSLEKLYGWSDYDKVCKLDNFDIQSFLDGCDHQPVIADIGCALSYAIGTRFNRNDVKWVMIDPLARFYNTILDANRNSRQRIVEGMIEVASLTLGVGKVDLIHVRNALDHCANPMHGVREALACLRIGGVLYLNHHRNEALRENYRGFHQYNIDIIDGNGVIWNENARYDIADELSEVAEVDCSMTDTGLVVVVIRKKRTLPEESEYVRNASLRAFEMLQLTIEAFASGKFAMSYYSKSVISTTAHKVMRRIPRQWVERLKKSLGKN